MRFNPSRSLFFLAAIVLASSSLLLCTSASPVVRDLGLALQKRAPAPTLSKVKVVHVDSTTVSLHESSVAVKAKTAAVSSEHSSAASSVTAIPSESSDMATSTASIGGASQTSAQSNITSPSVTQASVNPQSNAVSTGLSTPLVGGIAGVGGIIVVAAGFFAVVRYRKQKDLTKKVSSNANSFTVPGTIQSSSAISASAFPPHAPYERLDDPKPVGTFTVISTYTPTLGDELDIQPGDKVTVLVEYDDGWVQGINESRGRQKGVFPKHCVDYGQPYEDNNQSSMLGGGGGGGGGDKRVKRVSSMYGNSGAYGN